MTRRAISCVGLILLVACGGGSPAAPSPPPIAQVAGLWRATLTVTGATGGECLAPVPTGTSSDYTLSITQNGASLTASATSLATGETFTFEGTAGASSLTLNWRTCDACHFVGFVCATGARRDIVLQALSITATVSGSSATGTMGQTYNLFVSGTQTLVGSLTLNGTFTMTRQ